MATADVVSLEVVGIVGLGDLRTWRLGEQETSYRFSSLAPRRCPPVGAVIRVTESLLRGSHSS